MQERARAVNRAADDDGSSLLPGPAWIAPTAQNGGARTVSGSLLRDHHDSCFTEAVGDLHTSSLVALGVLLFLITFSVIAAARFLLLRLDRRALSAA